MICYCEDWEPNIELVNEPLGLWNAHGGNGYEGKQFVYCPWCGMHLRSERPLSSEKLDTLIEMIKNA